MITTNKKADQTENAISIILKNALNQRAKDGGEPLAKN
jgi:hypothetical protein